VPGSLIVGASSGIGEALAWLNQAAMLFERLGSGHIVGVSSIAGEHSRMRLQTIANEPNQIVLQAGGRFYFAKDSTRTVCCRRTCTAAC